jgi:hypothetical protein
MTPEHLHLVLNHLPVLGSAFALVPILVGLILGNRATLLTGLALAAVAGWMTPVVMNTGEAAHERYESGLARRFLDAKAGDFIEIHEERAEKGSIILYASAVVATLALILAIGQWPCWRIAGIAAALLCAGSIGAGVWIADTGGKIRRPDFRLAPVPADRG